MFNRFSKGARIGSTLLLAGLLAGCASLASGPIDYRFDPTVEGVQEAIAFAEERYGYIYVATEQVIRRPAFRAYLVDDTQLCWQPKNSDEVCYLLEDLRHITVRASGQSAGNAVGNTTNAILAAPIIVPYAILQSNARSRERQRGEGRAAERRAFADRFDADLPAGVRIVDDCTVGSIGPSQPNVEVCLSYSADLREQARATFFANLAEGGWVAIDSTDGVERFVQERPDGTTRQLSIETISAPADPDLANPRELFALSLSDR